MTCPVCAKNADPAYRPFCSRRCADIDLGRWLNESYRVPEEEQDDVDAPSTDSSQHRPQ